jgi:hypothetical protein
VPCARARSVHETDLEAVGSKKKTPTDAKRLAGVISLPAVLGDSFPAPLNRGSQL